MDETMVDPVVEVITRRVKDRLEPILEEDPTSLERHVSALDRWTLGALLRLTGEERAGAGRHLGVVGVDHSLNRLVVEEETEPGVRELEGTELADLDDEDLLAAARYVPETLPGYMLG